MSYLEELLPEFRKGAKIREPNWEQGEYIYLGKNGIVYDERNKPFDFTNEELFVEWELYQEPEPDWDYIIKNKCLCYFWDDTGKTKYLNYLQEKEEYVFRDEQGACWKNCRPVHRDEITFYEELK